MLLALQMILLAERCFPQVDDGTIAEVQQTPEHGSRIRACIAQSPDDRGWTLPRTGSAPSDGARVALQNTVLTKGTQGVKARALGGGQNRARTSQQLLHALRARPTVQDPT
jgi:hypothetical protein